MSRVVTRLMCHVPIFGHGSFERVQTGPNTFGAKGPGWIRPRPGELVSLSSHLRTDDERHPHPRPRSGPCQGPRLSEAPVGGADIGDLTTYQLRQGLLLTVRIDNRRPAYAAGSQTPLSLGCRPRFRIPIS